MPARVGSPTALTGALGAVGVLAVAAAVTFGILWGVTSAELRNAQADVRAAQSELSEVQGQLAASETEVADTRLAFYNLERGAKYTACVQYFGGFTQGAGFNAQVAVNVASDSCASESAWTFDIKPAP
jgi:hypothetical protein